MADLSAASADDVKSFFRTYYAPNNAFLAIVGDFDPAQAKAWVAKYFSDIPRGKPDRPAGRWRRCTLAGERRLFYEDRVQVPRLYIAVADGRGEERRPCTPSTCWQHPERSADRAADQGARLRQQAAASVGAYQDSNEDVGEFMVVITPRPGPHAHRARNGRRRGDREAQGRRADGRGGPEGHGRRGAVASCAASSRTSARR